jgi:hypothetical protein
LKPIFFSLLLSIHFFFSFGQESISFVPRFYDQAIHLNIPIQHEKETITFHTLKFYVTQFTCENVKKQVLQTQQANLVDLEDSTSQKLELSDSENKYIANLDKRTKHVSFLLGTDSSMNVSGMLEGPLDPINGMYWAWNSGYINLKAEGTIQDSAGNTSLFEFHIGGYLPPNETVRALTFELDLEKQIPLITLQINEWMEFAFDKGIHSLMIPGKTAVELANRIQSSIHLIYGND